MDQKCELCGKAAPYPEFLGDRFWIVSYFELRRMEKDCPTPLGKEFPGFSGFDAPDVTSHSDWNCCDSCYKRVVDLLRRFSKIAPEADSVGSKLFLG